MWTAETFFALLTGALTQLLVTIFAGSACTGTARKGADIANLIHWIHFYLTFILSVAVCGRFPQRDRCGFKCHFSMGKAAKKWVFTAFQRAQL